MYNRQHGQRRPPAVPQNYSGNAFYRVPYTEPEPELEPLPVPEPELADVQDLEAAPIPSEPVVPEKAPLFNIGGKLFPRGLGNEELLILALILMTSQGENGNEILLYLIFLLFC